MSDTEEKPGGRSLTDKQEAFCQHYTKHWNATRAAKEAGYSEHTAMEQGYQLLQIPSVKERISELSDHAMKEVGITRERILSELAKIAFGDMKDLASWTATGMRLIPSAELDEGGAACIAEVSETITESGGSLKIKRYDKVKALELLGKYQKLFADRLEHSGPDGKPIGIKNVSDLPDSELEARIQAMLGKDKPEPDAS